MPPKSKKKKSKSKKPAAKNSTGNVGKRLAALEHENQSLKQEIKSAQEDQLRFINLLVASQRLIQTLDVRGTLQVINEILINLVGSEQFGLYFIRGPGEGPPVELVCEVFEGGELPEPPNLSPEQIKKALDSGKVQVHNAKKDTPVAIIPLSMNSQTLGALVLYSVLPQKKEFTKIDIELFDLLANAAARAFYTAMMHSKNGLPQDLPTILKQALMIDSRF